MMNLEQQKISKLLFDLDPMMTCCRENDCFDEYDLISASVTELMMDGLAFEESLKTVFTDFFSEDLANRVDYAFLNRSLNGIKL